MSMVPSHLDWTTGSGREVSWASQVASFKSERFDQINGAVEASYCDVILSL